MNERFVQNNDTTTDTTTGLEWTKATIAKDVTHEQAEKTVAELGEGWRLPSVAELFSLIDHGKHHPAINTDAFPDTESDWYWTSTPFAWSDAAVWVVGFYNGSVYGNHRSNGGCVRAVRASQ